MDGQLTLTLKHEEQPSRIGGSMGLFAADWVRYEADTAIPHVQFGDGTGHTRHIYGGNVYVMNTSGKTIEVIRLRGDVGGMAESRADASEA